MAEHAPVSGSRTQADAVGFVAIGLAALAIIAAAVALWAAAMPPT